MEFKSIDTNIEGTMTFQIVIPGFPVLPEGFTSPTLTYM